MPTFSEKSEAVALQLQRQGAFDRDAGREVASTPAATPLLNAGVLAKGSRRPRGGSQTTVYWLTPLGLQFVTSLKGLRCRHCHCTEMNACKGGCHWVKKKPPVCSAPACVRKEARSLVRKTSAKRAAGSIVR